jgi:hypothetical protein
MGEQLYIPSFIVRSAGFKGGERVFVLDEDSTDPSAKPVCVLVKEQPAKSLHECIVSKDCHVLLTLAMLKNCGLTAENLEVGTTDGKILIRRNELPK